MILVGKWGSVIAQFPIQTIRFNWNRKEERVFSFLLLFLLSLSVSTRVDQAFTIRYRLFSSFGLWFDIFECFLPDISLPLFTPMTRFELQELLEQGLHLLSWQLQCDASLQHLPVFFFKRKEKKKNNFSNNNNNNYIESNQMTAWLEPIHWPL